MYNALGLKYNPHLRPMTWVQDFGLSDDEPRRDTRQHERAKMFALGCYSYCYRRSIPLKIEKN